MSTGLPWLRIEGITGLVIKETIAIAKVVINMEDLPSPIALITEIIGKNMFFEICDSIDREINISLKNSLLYNLLLYSILNSVSPIKGLIYL